MKTLQEIAQAIQQLPSDEIAHLRDWIGELTAQTPKHAAGVNADDGPPVNTGMLEALARIKERHRRMNPKQSNKDYLREAREGAMYDCEPER